MFLLTLSLAYAHLPHDNVAWVAAPQDLNTEQPWHLVVRATWIDLLLEMEDGGPAWHMNGGPPVADNLFGGAVLDDGTVVFLGEGRIWVDGVPEETPDLMITMVGTGDDVVLAGETGAWAWTIDEGFIRESQVRPQWMVSGPGGVVAGLADGTLARREANWAVLAAPSDSTSTAIAAEDGSLFAGDREGQVWALNEGEWTACAALPAPSDDREWRPDVVQLAVDGDTLLAGSGWRAPFVSGLECASWEDLGAPLDTEYFGEGAAEDATEAVTALLAHDGRWVVAGWAGIAISDDQGESWVSEYLVPASYTRGLAFSSGWADDGLLWMGSTSSGLIRSCDGGESWDLPGSDQGAANVQWIAPNPDDPDDVAMIAGHDVWRTTDRGENWTAVLAPMSRVASIGWTDNALWLLSGAEPRVARVVDGEVETVQDVVDLLGESQPEGVVQADGVICIVASQPLRAICEQDGVWSEAWGGGFGRTTHPVVWSEDDAARLVLGTEAGMVVVDDLTGALTQTLLFDDDQPTLLEQTDDGTLFVVTRTGVLLRSDDGGLTWADLGTRFSSIVHVLAPGPGFADDGILLAGTHEGIVRIDPDTGAVEAWAGIERIDDRVLVEACEGCPDLFNTDAPIGTLLSLDPAAVITIGVEGNTVRVVGTAGGEAPGQIWIDGEQVGELGAARTGELGQLALVEDLDDGWHTVELYGWVDSDVFIDHVAAWQAASFLDAPEPVEGPCVEGVVDSADPIEDPPDGKEPRCGCASGKAGVGALWPLILLAFRRRRANGG